MKEQRRWTRTYPPLILIAVAILGAIVVLPSALNLPQSNPATVLEYAPVPPQDRNPPPNTGNLSTLGLGSSATLVAAAPAPSPPLPPTNGGNGARPNEKHCVGSPPRQTEDPAAPPCVPFFDGDNFGKTWQGVTGTDITVLVYFQVGAYDGEETPAPGTYVDIDRPRLPACTDNEGAAYTDPQQCDHVFVRVLKSYTHYFNDRYQTYNRRVHYWAFFSGANNASARRGDAVANYERLHPFAVLDEAAIGAYNQEYEVAMTQLKVLSFSSSAGVLPSEFYKKSAPLAWGFYPDVEHWAAQYASYVCQKVGPYPVRHFGNPPGVGAPNGSKRRIGLWYTTDPGRQDYRLFADLVKDKLSACHANVVEQATFSHSGYSVNGQDSGTEAAQGVAKFQAKNVTTVLYMGGEEGRFSSSADAVRYYPEIVVAGDLHVDGRIFASLQNQNVWQNAWGTTFALRISRPEDSPAYRAYKEGDPQGDSTAAGYAQGAYRDHFMLFEAIQVSGPKLNPNSIDQGLHAIPEKPSADPFTAAFFFDPGDYTSVKDEAEQWWDPQAQPAGANTPNPGCYRMVVQGKRSLAGHWKGGDQAFRNASDPCNLFNAGFYYYI